MNQNIFKNIKKVHFIGIGGIGVSALARMMLLLNKKVSGSDLAWSEAAKKIKKSGGRVLIGHQKSNLSKKADMVIYSPAIKKDNPELNSAIKLKIPVYSYPEALGMISQDMFTIAVAGTHGKTTTTAMIAEIMLAVGKSPTVVVGSFLKKQKENFILGRSKYFIVETCEYKESFLNLFPDILIITNIDNDHLDYFKNIGNIRKSFAKMINKIHQAGFLVCNPKDKNTELALKLSKSKTSIVDYTKEKKLKLIVPGEHNIKNAQAALAVAKLIKIKKEKDEKALKQFSGTWRRFEYKGKTKSGVLIYDDYAHHPAEIRATLEAAREKFKNNKIIVVFQPHLYSRTKLLLNDFAKSFNQADDLIITDIYAAREKNDKSIHAKDLVKAIKKFNPFVHYFKNFGDITKYLKNNAQKKDVIITIGAGDIYKVGDMLIKV